MQVCPTEEKTVDGNTTVTICGIDAETFCHNWKYFVKDENENIKPFKAKTITKDEALAIISLSDIAAEQSKHLTGLLVREFNSVEFGAIVIGDISIGDNETFAKIIETIVNRMSKAFTEIELTNMFAKSEGQHEYLKGIFKTINIVNDLAKKSESKKKGD